MPISLIMFFIFRVFYHALIVMIVLAGFILVCICYAVDLKWLAYFVSLIYDMLIICFTMVKRLVCTMNIAFWIFFYID